MDRTWSNYNLDLYGVGRDSVDTTGMTSPVRCTHCGGVYDVGTVTVTARYSDCFLWKSLCCGRQVDDRPKGWKSRSDIEWLNR